MIQLTGNAEVMVRLQQAGRLQRALIKAVAAEVVALTKAHVNAQTDIQGAAFTPRKSGRRKMEVKLGRSVKVLAETPRETLIGWPALRASQIAARQQLGLAQTITVAQYKRSMAAREGSSTSAATSSQATALLAVGYKRRSAGSGLQTPTKKWIKETLSAKQAGAILRALRGASVVTSWQINLPARSFLGVSPAEVMRLNRLLIERMRAELTSS